MEEKIQKVLYFRKQKLTYEEIGKIMNLTRERVRQMESKALSTN